MDTGVYPRDVGRCGRGVRLGCRGRSELVGGKASSGAIEPVRRAWRKDHGAQAEQALERPPSEDGWRLRKEVTVESY